MEELKPCPFCGEKPRVSVERGEKYKAVVVRCDNCGTKMTIDEKRIIGYWKESRTFGTVEERAVVILGDKIAKKWNRREL